MIILITTAANKNYKIWWVIAGILGVGVYVKKLQNDNLVTGVIDQMPSLLALPGLSAANEEVKKDPKNCKLLLK